MVTETRYRATSISARHLYRRARRAGQGRTGVRRLVRDLEQELEPPTLALDVELTGAGLARVAKETLALAKPFRLTLDGPSDRVGAVFAAGHVPRDGLVVVDDPEFVCHLPTLVKPPSPWRVSPLRKKDEPRPTTRHAEPPDSHPPDSDVKVRLF